MVDMGQADSTLRRVGRARRPVPVGQIKRAEYIMRTTPPPGADWAMMRIYVGGAMHGQRQVAVRNLTREECKDEVAFPLGMQVDNFGNEYVFSHVHQSCL